METENPDAIQRAPKRSLLDGGVDATYRNEDEYIRRCTTFHTYAVVTPNGEWHAVGEMGWFGFSSESPATRREWEQEYHKRFLEPAQENDWYMVIVDCHI